MNNSDYNSDFISVEDLAEIIAVQIAHEIIKDQSEAEAGL